MRRGTISALAIGLISLGLIWTWHTRTPQTASPGATEWRISSEPALVIGASDQDPLYLVGAIIRLSDGRLIVGDGFLGSPRLLSFSSEGRYLGAFGREGDGPGEYRWVASLQRGANDSIFVYDAAHQRLTAFSARGQVGRTQTYRVRDSDRLLSARRLADGVWVGRGIEHILPAPINGLVRDTIVIGLMDSDLGELQPLTYLPGLMTTANLIAGRRGTRPPSFSPRVIDAIWGRCVFMAATDSRSVFVYASDGSLVTEFEGPGELRVASDQDLQASIEAELPLINPEEHQGFRRMMEKAAHPETLPFYNHMVLDQWGHIWLQEYAPEHIRGQGPKWLVLSQDGRHLANVLLPPRMEVHHITEDGFLGVRRGEFDEERVELLPLLGRPPEGTPLPQCVEN